MMYTRTKLTAEEYLHTQSRGEYEILRDYPDIRKLLGKPFKYTDKDYPDDHRKTDVCRGFRNDQGDVVIIWNFKNGHYMDRKLSDIGCFSCYVKTDKMDSLGLSMSHSILNDFLRDMERDLTTKNFKSPLQAFLPM